jgi:hypothetical protein
MGNVVYDTRVITITIARQKPYTIVLGRVWFWTAVP